MSGDDPHYAAVVDDETSNKLDVVILSVKPGVDAKFMLHDHPVHTDDRVILSGAIAPSMNAAD